MLAIALDGLLLLLLLAALGIGLRIHQGLRRLRQDDGSLERLIEALDAATQRAEAALGGLKRTAEETSAGLQGDLERLQRLGDDLQFLSDRAGQQADRLEDQIRRGRGRSGPAMPAAAPTGPATPARPLGADDLERRLRTLR